MRHVTGISYTPRFVLEVHCTFARTSFNEHPNSLSLRTLICSTFIEGHLTFPQDIFLSCWNDYFLFYRHNSFYALNILGQQLLFKRKHRGVHRGVVPVHGHVYRTLRV